MSILTESGRIRPSKRCNMKERVLEKFGQAGMHWSMLGRDGELKLNELLAMALCRLQHVDLPTIVEIGTHRAVSACILAECGHVKTFDIKRWDLREEVVEYFGKRDRIEFKDAGGDKQLGITLAGMDFDLAFIDGCHAYNSVRDNFLAVRKCGRVIFHDYEHEFHLDRTVKYVDEISTGRTTKIVPFALWESWEVVRGEK